MTDAVTIKKEPGVHVRGTHCTVFKLSTGNAITFLNSVHADAYEGENSDVIVETLPFDTADEHKAYQATVNTARPRPLPVSAGSGSLSAADQAALTRMEQRRNQRSPQRCFSCAYKHTLFSRAVPFFWDILDHKGVQVWNTKLLDYKALLPICADDDSVHFSGRHTKQIMQNMQGIEKRDLEKGPTEPLKSKTGYTIHKIVSYFTIPDNVPEIQSMEMEKQCIESTLKTLTSDLITHLTSPVFHALYRKHTESSSEKYRAIIFSPTRGLNFAANIKTCVAVIKPILSYSEHTIVDRFSIIRNILASHDQAEPKYLTDAELLAAASASPPVTAQTATQLPVPAETTADGGGSLAPGFNLSESQKNSPPAVTPDKRTNTPDAIEPVKKAKTTNATANNAPNVETVDADDSSVEEESPSPSTDVRRTKRTPKPKQF